MSRLVLVHGFTQTAASWSPVASLLSRRHEAVALDAPGHGSRAAVRAGPWEAAALLARDGGRGVWVGYSMGGRLALHVALAHPEVVTGLVLVGATAGIDDGEERHRRRHADEALADRIEQLGVDAFLDEWLAQPLLATAPPDRPARADDAAGLAASLRLTGTGAQEPLWERLPELAVPVLVVAGEQDRKFRSVAERLVAGIRNAEALVVPGAGHACHLESPSAFVAGLERWLRGHPETANPRANSAP